jgi:DeoR family suf operon transcriptional repressor
MSYLPLTKRDLLGALKIRTEGATCGELAEATGFSLSSARNQLGQLASQGLVERTPIRDGPGRPEYLYRLTEQADDVFANQENPVAVGLLLEVAGLAPEAFREAVDRRTDQQIEEKRQALAGTSGRERAQRLAETFEEEGFVIVVSSPVPAEIRLSVRHCPIRELAAAEPYICLAEERCVAALFPGADVWSTDNVNASGTECCFRIREAT